MVENHSFLKKKEVESATPLRSYSDPPLMFEELGGGGGAGRLQKEEMPKNCQRQRALQQISY